MKAQALQAMTMAMLLASCATVPVAREAAVSSKPAPDAAELRARETLPPLTFDEKMGLIHG